MISNQIKENLLVNEGEIDLIFWLIAFDANWETKWKVVANSSSTTELEAELDEYCKKVIESNKVYVDWNRIKVHGWSLVERTQ